MTRITIFGKEKFSSTNEKVSGGKKAETKPKTLC
jgi:hypothetical protein